MSILIVLIPFVLSGVAVIFVAFSGGPGAAREAYLTKGSRAFTVLVPIAFLGLGVVVPGLVLANRGQAQGGAGDLQTASLSKTDAEGKLLFRERCASCHTLKAVNARGVTGPNLDRIGEVSKKRVLSAIKIGGTGEKRMPANLVNGADAEHVASYLSKVAGR